MADLIDREQALGCFWNYGYTDGTGYDETEMPAYDRLQALPIVAEVEDCISRQAAIDAIAKFVPYAICDESTESYTNGLTDAYNLICQLPSAQPEKRTEERTKRHACDCISRQAAIDCCRNEWEEEVAERIEALPSAQPEQPPDVQDILEYIDTVLHPIVSPEHWNIYSELYDMISVLPSTQKTQLSEESTTKLATDCISRQAALDALGEEPEVWTGRDEYAQGLNNQWHYDVNALKALPSAQSEIICCKDCKHYQFADNRAFGMPVKMCKWFGFEDVDDDDFCSRAERR